MNNHIFNVGWNAAWGIYPKENIIQGIWRSILIMAIAMIGCWLSSKSSLDLLKIVVGWIIDAFPNIIGFVLSGYAILIGFCGTRFLTQMTGKEEEGEPSLFQIVSSTFVVVIYIVILTYVVGFLIDFIISCDIECPLVYNIGCERYNFFWLIITLFLFSYSITALLDIVINLFNIGQLAISSNNLEQETKVVEKDNPDNLDNPENIED